MPPFGFDGFHQGGQLEAEFLRRILHAAQMAAVPFFDVLGIDGFGTDVHHERAAKAVFLAQLNLVGQLLPAELELALRVGRRTAARQDHVARAMRDHVGVFEFGSAAEVLARYIVGGAGH